MKIKDQYDSLTWIKKSQLHISKSHITMYNKNWSAEPGRSL